MRRLRLMASKSTTTGISYQFYHELLRTFGPNLRQYDMNIDHRDNFPIILVIYSNFSYYLPNGNIR